MLTGASTNNPIQGTMHAIVQAFQAGMLWERAKRQQDVAVSELERLWQQN